MRFGATPWDSLSREELLREVQRMASALVSARGVLRQAELGQEANPYWGSIHGSGRKAIDRCSVALKRYDETGDSKCYRAFFRYANDLLFPDEAIPCGTLGANGWLVCEKCATFKMTLVEGPGSGICCGTTMRPLRWSDLEPTP